MSHKQAKQRRQALRRLMPPQDQPHTSNQKVSARIPMGPDDWGEWTDFVVEPVGKGGQLLQQGPTGRYKVVLYVGASIPEPRMEEALLQPRPCPLRIPGIVKLVCGHARDGGSPPEFTLIPDASGALDRIEVIMELRHLDPVHGETELKSGHDIGPQVAAEEEAYRRIMGYLSWYSFQKRVPITVHSIVSEDLASGHLHFGGLAPHPTASIAARELVQGVLVDEFVKGFGLYREALASENPFYRFLTLFKVWELIEGAKGYEGLRARICKELKAAGLDPGRPEERFVSGPYSGQRYVDVLNGDLRAKYRDAVAHVTLAAAEAKRPDDLADIRAMQRAAAQLHKAIRDILTNECNAYQRLQAQKAGQATDSVS